MPPPVSKPLVIADPGFLWITLIATAAPTHTSAAGKFTDVVPATYIPLGATTDGTTFSYGSTVEPIRAAELFDVVEYRTTDRTGSIAFNLMNYTLSNYRRALNGGIAAMTATGTVGSEVTVLEPVDPGAEVRAQILWESTNSDLRLLCRQTLQGGEVASAFQSAPSVAVIPCTFNLEVPAVGKLWSMWAAGTARV